MIYDLNCNSHSGTAINSFNRDACVMLDYSAVIFVTRTVTRTVSMRTLSDSIAFTATNVYVFLSQCLLFSFNVYTSHPCQFMKDYVTRKCLGNMNCHIHMRIVELVLNIFVT